MAKRLTDGERGRVVQLLREGNSYREIAKHVDVSLATISSIAASAGIKPSGRVKHVEAATTARRIHTAATRSEQSERIISQIADIEMMWQEEIAGDKDIRRLFQLARTTSTLAMAHKTLEEVERASRTGDGSAEARSMMSGLLEGITAMHTGLHG